MHIAISYPEKIIQPGTINYSNNFIEIPLASTCITICMLAYMVVSFTSFQHKIIIIRNQKKLNIFCINLQIIRKMVISRKSTASVHKHTQKKNHEYKLVVNRVNTTMMISFSYLPSNSQRWPWYIRVRGSTFEYSRFSSERPINSTSTGNSSNKTDESKMLFSIITFLVEINSLMNAAVYMINNAEVMFWPKLWGKIDFADQEIDESNSRGLARFRRFFSCEHYDDCGTTNFIQSMKSIQWMPYIITTINLVNNFFKYNNKNAHKQLLWKLFLIFLGIIFY